LDNFIQISVQEALKIPTPYSKISSLPVKALISANLLTVSITMTQHT